MKYIVDNDLHIHSVLSLCSGDERQNTERILQYAKENGLKTICITDHFWDDALKGASEWYSKQNYTHISASKPLPQDDTVDFLFGCETELNGDLTVGISREKQDLFDFIIIPTTHFHMVGYTLMEEDITTPENRAKMWVKRLEAVLNMNLPFYKIGLAHLTCKLIAPTMEEYLATLNHIPDDDMERLFSKAAQLGAGVELNSFDMDFDKENSEAILRPYRIAKKCGCKFYLGSDAHKTEDFARTKQVFERAVDLLELTEDDKFVVRR